MDKRKPELKIDNVIKRSKPSDKQIDISNQDTNDDDNEEPLIQAAQKCPWCFDWLWSYDDLDVYNGDNPSYKGWISHKKCNKAENLT